MLLGSDGNTGEFHIDSSISTWKGVANVTMDDGTQITVVTEKSPEPGSRLFVTDNAASGSLAGGHGQVAAGYLGYRFEFLDAAGSPMTDEFEYRLSITGENITPEFNMFLKEGSEVNAQDGYSVSGNTIAPDGGWTNWKAGIKYTGGSPDIVSGRFQPFDGITFQSTGGEYTIPYILGNYNVFVPGDYICSHVTGPVIVGGQVKGLGSLGGISNPDVEGIQEYKHEVPSYIGSKLQNQYKGITTNSDIPVYLGPDEMGKGDWTITTNQWVTPNTTTNDYYYVSGFVDFDTAMEAIKDQADDIAKDPEAVPVKGESGDGYELCGTTLKLYEGRKFKLTADQLDSLRYIDYQDGYDGEPIYLVVEDEGIVNIPRTLIRGEGNYDCFEEALHECNIVWIIPNADTVTAISVTGHIVAPNANVTLTGGNFEGCVVAQNVDAGTGAEGHHWPLRSSGGNSRQFNCRDESPLFCCFCCVAFGILYL